MLVSLHASFCREVGVKLVEQHLTIVLDGFFAFEVHFDFIVRQGEVGHDILLGDEIFPDVRGDIVAEDPFSDECVEEEEELFLTGFVPAVVDSFDFRYAAGYFHKMEEDKAVLPYELHQGFDPLPEMVQCDVSDVFALHKNAGEAVVELIKEHQDDVVGVFVVVLEVAVADVQLFGDMPYCDDVDALFIEQFEGGVPYFFFRIYH